MSGQGTLVVVYALSFALLAAYGLGLWRQARSQSKRRQ
jgi:hypothetical protein